MKVNYLLILAGVLFLFSFRFDETDPTIELKWQADRPLSWQDFIGDVDPESSFDAWTWSGISYSYSWFTVDDEIEVELDAYAYFDPTQSWVKKGKMTPALLAHEQLHFDIAELHARYFLERAEQFDYTQNIEAELDSIYTVTFNEMLAMQIQYDEESDHFKNKEGQHRWNNFIQDELDRLD